MKLFFLLSILDGNGFISGQYSVTLSPGATEATLNISVMKDSLEQSTEYFILHFYISTDSYEHGVQKGNIRTVVVSIFIPGMNLHELL